MDETGLLLTMVRCLCKVLLFLMVGCTIGVRPLTYRCFPDRDAELEAFDLFPGRTSESHLKNGQAGSAVADTATIHITFSRERTGQAFRQCSVTTSIHGTNGDVRLTEMSSILKTEEQRASLKHSGVKTGPISHLQIQLPDDRQCSWYPNTVTMSTERKLPVHYTCIRFRDYLTYEKPQRIPRSADNVFEVIVKTGDDFGAGTDANVYVVIHGEKGDEPEQKLDGSFQLGTTVSSMLEAGNAGKVKAITIRHDNTGWLAAWKLNNVSFYENSEETGRFICNCWLDNTENSLSKRLDNKIVCTPSGGECGGHGVCVDGTSCNCRDSYTGRFCSVPPCTLHGNECGSHGLCKKYGSTNRCDCSDNYNGTFCTIPPCTADGGECGRHGFCNTNGSANLCKCIHHYDGIFCTTPPCTHNGNQCGSHGSCNVDGSSNYCDCHGGYSGPFCTKFAPPCTPDGDECGSHGACSINEECSCTDNYSGQLCTVPPCTNSGGECGKHGSCKTNGSANICDCTENYTGTLCTIPPCTANGTECGKHGSCEIKNSTAACVCNNGYSGTFCGTELLCTVDGNQCKNGGKCMTDTATHRCQCNAWYTGTTCDIRRSSAAFIHVSVMCFLVAFVSCVIVL